MSESDPTPAGPVTSRDGHPTDEATAHAADLPVAPDASVPTRDSRAAHAVKTCRGFTELIPWNTLVALATTALLAFLWWPAARLDFFFDEMWRIEIVRSSSPTDAYLAGPAPIPPGWVFALSSVFDLVPDRRPLLRFAAASLAVPAAVLLAIAVRRVLERRMVPLLAYTTASIAAPLAIATPALAIHATYFNNYMTDVVVAVAIIWALVAIDDAFSDSKRPWFALLALAIVAPWFAQGALFLLPGAALIVYRNRHRHRRIASASGLTTLVSTGLVGLVFLRPVANEATLTEYWSAETPEVGLASFIRRLFTTFVDGAYPQSLVENPLALAAMGGFTALGAFVLHSAWRWWLPLFGSAAIFAVAASIATGWPATFVRSNSSFQILLFVLAPIGIVWAAVQVAMWIKRLTGSPLAAATGLLAIGLAVAAVWVPQSIRANSESEGVFARGLTDDVGTVAVRLEQGNVVFAYHLSGPYVRDRVLNADDVVDGVAVVDEARVGRLTDLSPWTSDSTGSVWCVIPFEAGPDATAAACPASAGWSIATTETGNRSTLIRLVRNP